MANPHPGEYTRKVIVDKVPSAYQDRIEEEITQGNGRFFVIELKLPTEMIAFLQAYDTEYDNQSGNAFTYRRSPWMYADPTENNKLFYGKRGNFK